MHMPELLSKIGAVALVVAILTCADVRADSEDKPIDSSAKTIARVSDKKSSLNYHSLIDLMSSGKPWTYHHRRRLSFRQLDDGTQVWRKPDGTLHIVPPDSLLCNKTPKELCSSACTCCAERPPQ